MYADAVKFGSGIQGRTMKRPDRFPQSLDRLVSVSAHELRWTRATMKPVRSDEKVNALRECDPHCPALPAQGKTPPPRAGRQEGVPFAPAFGADVDIVPEPFATATPVRINSASGMPSILDKAFKGALA
jgi:hypothetical protein